MKMTIFSKVIENFEKSQNFTKVFSFSLNLSLSFFHWCKSGNQVYHSMAFLM